MNLNVIHDRNQAIEFSIRIAERFYPGPGGAEWSGFDTQLPKAARAQAKTAIQAAKSWRQSPDLTHYRDVHRWGRRVARMSIEPGLELLELARACCGCVTEDWVYWAWKASDVAQSVIWGEEGPGSCVDLEVYYEIMDLRQISGCRLRDIVSPDSHVEGMEEQFAQEQESELRDRAAALGLSIVTEGRHEPTNCRYKAMHDNQMFIALHDGEPLGYTDVGWSGIPGLLDTIEREERFRLNFFNNR